MHLQSCHCMSYMDNSDDDAVVMGACPYLCTDYIYLDIHADTNLSNLCNSHIQQNRQGQMCGYCKENHSPSPYSYQLKCAHCSRYRNNWLKYVVMAYLSSTIFFLVVIFFRFSALSASMNAFIFISQIVSSPSVITLMSTFANFGKAAGHNNVIITLKILTTAFGIWNLDFFRMLYKPYCLHPNLSIIQVMCLDYAVAMYPLLQHTCSLSFTRDLKWFGYCFNHWTRYGYLHMLLIINGMHLPRLSKPMQPSFYFHM